jgi:hypothetical protein
MCYKMELGTQVPYQLRTVKNLLPGYEESLDYLMRLFSTEKLTQSRMVECF